jgi:cobalamin biosynthesis Mg chelatase CobN
MKLKYGLLIFLVVFSFLMIPSNVFALEDSNEASSASISSLALENSYLEVQAKSSSSSSSSGSSSSSSSSKTKVKTGDDETTGDASTGMPWWIWLVIGGVILLIIIIIIWYFVLRK